MDVPIGTDTKSIFHGVVNFHLFYKVKPLIRMCLRDLRNISSLGLIGKVKLALRLWRLYKEIGRLEPVTRGNANRHNTFVFLDMAEDFFANEKNPSRHPEFDAICNLFLLMFDGDYYYWERIEYEIYLLYLKILSGEYQLRMVPPRATWWGHDEACPTCFQVKGSQRIFANCPANMHS